MNSLLTFVYRNSLGDSTNNGITSNQDQLNLYYGDLDEEAIANLPDDSLIFISRELWGKPANYAVPVKVYRSNPRRHSMFGGNFVYTSDSRFPQQGPLSIHDRVEG